MSSNALRWSAVPLGLLAFALGLVVRLWVEPLTWRLSLGTELLVFSGAILVAAGIPVGVFAVLLRGDRWHPARFVPARGGFTVPPSPVHPGYQAIMWTCLGSRAVMTERVPGGMSVRLAQLDFAWPATLVGVGLFWAVALAFLLVARPQLHLDAGGLTIRRVLRRRTRLAWDDLAPGGPQPPAKRGQRQLKVYLAAPPVFGRYPSSEDIPIGWLHVDPAFLAAALRHYVAHPEDRAAIGSTEELTRLQSVRWKPEYAPTPAQQSSTVDRA
jgi:hypothetical protein